MSVALGTSLLALPAAADPPVRQLPPAPPPQLPAQAPKPSAPPQPAAPSQTPPPRAATPAAPQRSAPPTQAASSSAVPAAALQQLAPPPPVPAAGQAPASAAQPHAFSPQTPAAAAEQTTAAPPPATDPPPSAAEPQLAPAAADATTRQWQLAPEPTQQGAAPASNIPPAPNPPPEWRGWQTLVVDLAGVGIGLAVAASAHTDSSGPGLVAATWYAVGVTGAPAVHYAHGQWPAGMGDLAVRAFFPPLVGLGGLMVSCLAHERFERDCSQPGLAAGMLLGLGGVAAFDALVLSNEHPRETKPESWYGFQTLAVDLVAYGIGAYYAAKEPREGKERPHPGLSLWVMDYLIGSVGAPIVHFAHGNVGRGFASLGVRLGLGPIGSVLGVIGACAGTAGNDHCAREGAQYGLFGGSLAMALLDAFVFARDAKESTTASNVGFTVGAGSVGVNARW